MIKLNLLEKKQYVNDYQHLVPADEIALYNYNFACVYTKNSACIEGNQIVTVEDVVSITKGFNVRIDETLKRSIYNHYRAYNYMLDYIAGGNELNEDFVKDLHEMLLAGLIPGGLYRNINISIKGSMHTPCDYIKVYDRMKKYYFDISNYEGTDIQKASYAHLQLAKIHPFLDGNGRLARLILNFVLIKEGYLPISIPAKSKNHYFELLEEFKVNKNPEPFAKYLEELMNKEYDRLIALIDKYKK